MRRNTIYSNAQHVLNALKGAVYNFTVLAAGRNSREKNSNARSVLSPRVQLTLDEMHEVEHLWESAKTEIDRAGSYTSILEFNHAHEHVQQMSVNTQALIQKLETLSSTTIQAIQSCT